MKNPGPPLEALIDRLSSIPGEFTRGSLKAEEYSRNINVPAAVNDLLLECGGKPLSDNEINKYFHGTSGDKKKKNNYPGIVSILCYIYMDKFFTANKGLPDLIRKFLLSQKLIELSDAVDSSDEFIFDAERREEICRMALDALDFYPQGETEKNADDRLTTLDSVERKKILTSTREAQKRAKELQEAMMRKEAEEAASKMSRE